MAALAQSFAQALAALPVETLPVETPQAEASETLAQLAVDALLDEARLAPKPGLVDSRGNGAHSDLTLDMMCRSANALRPAFMCMAAAARDAAAPSAALRETLGRLGRDAEATMMATTGGVNTHRGAIWAMGLLVGAAAIVTDNDVTTTNGAEQTASVAAAIARHGDRFAPTHTGHKGEQACRDYNVTGARGQAQAGFPHVMGLGLPELRRCRARGDSETASRLNALLAIMSRLDDTCVLARGGLVALRHVQDSAAMVLSAGGVAALAGRRALRQLDADALACGVSPGGAADLLAATLFLDRLEHAFAASGRTTSSRRLHGAT
jgi:triphosphoribosyl-dephospho-CoA synthase